MLYRFYIEGICVIWLNSNMSTCIYVQQFKKACGANDLAQGAQNHKKSFLHLSCYGSGATAWRNATL